MNFIEFPRWEGDLNFTVGIGNPNLTLQTWNLTIDCSWDLSLKEKQQNLSHQRTKTRQKQQTWKTVGFPWRETLSLQNSIDIWWQITSKPVIIIYIYYIIIYIKYIYIYYIIYTILYIYIYFILYIKYYIYILYYIYIILYYIIYILYICRCLFFPITSKNSWRWTYSPKTSPLISNLMCVCVLLCLKHG